MRLECPTIFSPTPIPSRAPAPIPRSFLSFPQIVKFSPLLSSKCLRANTSVPTEKGKRSPCGATVPTPPPLFLSPRPERTEDRTLGRACRIPIGREGLFLIRDLDCKIPVEDAPVVDLSGLMRVGCRSGYYRQYRWLALKKRRGATSMSRPPLLLCPSRRGDITIQPELYQRACCIGLHLEVVHRGPGHKHTSAS